MSPISPQNFSQLLRRHGPPLVLYARQWCACPEDVVQDAFCRLMTQSKEPDHLVAWLYRVVRNGALNAARADRRRSRNEADAARRIEPWFEVSNGHSLDVREATHALEQLSESERETVVARLWGGLSFEEVAELTGVSLSTAYRRYQGGIRSLRERLGATCPENETSRNRKR